MPGHRVRFWLTWWVGLFVLYLLLVFNLQTAELVAGAVCAAVALLVFGLGIAFVPGLADQVQGAAAQLQDRPAYAATALHGSPMAAAAPMHAAGPSALDWIYGTLSMTGALALAAVALRRGRVRDAVPAGLGRTGDRALHVLRSLHSGHVGDYVTWLVVGTAALGGLFAVSL